MVSGRRELRVGAGLTQKLIVGKGDKIGFKDCRFIPAFWEKHTSVASCRGNERCRDQTGSITRA